MLVDFFLLFNPKELGEREEHNMLQSALKIEKSSKDMAKIFKNLFKGKDYMCSISYEEGQRDVKFVSINGDQSKFELLCEHCGLSKEDYLREVEIKGATYKIVAVKPKLDEHYVHLEDMATGLKACAPVEYVKQFMN